MSEWEMDIGNTVKCDACNEDYTDSDAQGGMLFVSKAICPKCTPRWVNDAKAYGESHHIRAEAAPWESFRDFVLRIRGGNNKVRVAGNDKDVADWRKVFEQQFGAK